MICSKCKTDKPADNYYNTNTGWCKECSKQYARERYRKQRGPKKKVINEDAKYTIFYHNRTIGIELDYAELPIQFEDDRVSYNEYEVSYEKFREFTNDTYLFQLATLMEFAPLFMTSHLYDFTTQYLETLFIMNDENMYEYDVLKNGNHAFYSAVLHYEDGLIIEQLVPTNLNITRHVIADMIESRCKT